MKGISVYHSKEIPWGSFFFLKEKETKAKYDMILPWERETRLFVKNRACSHQNNTKLFMIRKHILQANEKIPKAVWLD